MEKVLFTAELQFYIWDEKGIKFKWLLLASHLNIRIMILAKWKV